MHGGCNFENNLNQIQYFKFQNKICQLWCKLAKHDIIINNSADFTYFCLLLESYTPGWHFVSYLEQIFEVRRMEKLLLGLPNVLDCNKIKVVVYDEEVNL